MKTKSQASRSASKNTKKINQNKNLWIPTNYFKYKMKSSRNKTSNFI